MKRGFMKTPRYKRAIEEENTPSGTPPGKDSAHRTPHGKDGKEAGIASDLDCANAMDVDTTDAEEVYADGRVVAVRMTKKPRVSCDEENGNEATPHPKAKGKGKAKLVDAMDTSPEHNLNKISIPRRPPPGRPGWGREHREEFFHTVPQSHGGPHIKRAVFRCWPRSPNGMALLPSVKHQGTLSPDGYPWGATLYDIYNVNRHPHVIGMVSIMTGSALREQVEVLGELDAAAPEIEWAKSEGQPRVVGAADTEELIRSRDTMSQVLPFFNSLFPNVDREGKDENQNAHWHDHEGRPVYIPPSPEISAGSPHYPKQWPIVPFEHSLSILLQERVPLHLLPQTLYVHDPFGLLAVREQVFHNTSWTSRPEIIRTYNLQFADPVRSQVVETRRKAEELEEFKARTLVILRYTRTKEQIRKHEPMIEIPLPPYPRRTTKTEEGHLYLSPVTKVGEGHHSIVYKAELELPRHIFMKERICQLCHEESTDKEIKRLKQTGRWEKMLRAASWGPNGYTGRKPTKEELAAVSDGPNLKNDEEIIEREITCVVPPNVNPSQILSVLDEINIWGSFMKEKERNAVQLHFAREGDGLADESTTDSYVAGMRINPQFGYISQKSCSHDKLANAPVPRTARFTVVAKLSLEYDPHLAREASNYQKFPEHFFNHYNGYTIVSQLHTIVPVNAIVPQFYGYYKPEKEKRRNSEEPAYLSPILLLEHCGQPIEPEEISTEDQEECASMLLRFQRSGWLHESVAPRNFLVQYGKPTEFPLTRQYKPEPSYRLIDFGRSRKYDNVADKRSEEGQTLRMFQKLYGKMGYTLRM